MEKQGRKIHGQAEMAREKGEFLEALKFTDEAMVTYQQEGDVLGFAEVQASRFLTLRHLWEKTGDRNYLILAKHNAMASVEIAEASGDLETLAIPYFNLAKVQEEMSEFSSAVESYRKAVKSMESNPPEPHARPAVLADMKGHMAVCEYKAGDRSAIQRAEAALQELEATDELKYNKDVWMSGAYMKMAGAVKSEDAQKAEEYLDKADKIIKANPELELRAGQLEKLRAQLEL